MMLARLSSLVLILALLVAASDAPPKFTVAQITTVPTEGTVVGARRSGLLCSPAGRLHWRDIAPGEDRMKRHLAVALTAAGIDTKIPSDDDFDHEVRTPYRITVSVLRVDADVCVPWRALRLGGQARIKATGRLVTVWRVFDQKARALILKGRICVSLSDRQQDRNGVSFVETGMMRAAADFASLYRRAIRDASDATPEHATGCSAAEGRLSAER